METGVSGERLAHIIVLVIHEYRPNVRPSSSTTISMSWLLCPYRLGSEPCCLLPRRYTSRAFTQSSATPKSKRKPASPPPLSRYPVMP